MATGKRAGEFCKVGENLYRYSSNKRYYAVFRSHGKLFWRSLRTSDRKLADRKLAQELAKRGRVDASAQRITLEGLLKLYEEQLPQFDDGTRTKKRSILKKFRETWPGSFSTPV